MLDRINKIGKWFDRRPMLACGVSITISIIYVITIILVYWI